MLDPELYTRLGRLEAKMDMVLAAHDDLKGNHEARITKLERSRTYLLGVWAVVSFIVATVFTIVLKSV